MKIEGPKPIPGCEANESVGAAVDTGRTVRSAPQPVVALVAEAGEPALAPNAPGSVRYGEQAREDVTRGQQLSRQSAVFGTRAVGASVASNEPLDDAAIRRVLPNQVDRVRAAFDTRGQLAAVQATLQNPSLAQEGVGSARGGVALAAEIMPNEAQCGSGDFVRVIQRGDGKLSLCLLDVLDHGDGAAFVSLALQRAARKRPYLVACNQDSPAAALAALDQEIRKFDEPDLAAVGMHALFDPATGKLTCAHAEAPMALLLKATGVVAELPALKEGRGSRLGPSLDEMAEAFPEGQVIRAPQPVEVQLEPGDIFLMWSDGVPDSLVEVPPRDVSARFAELLAKIAAEKPTSPQQVVDRLRAELPRDAQGCLADDATMLALRWRGPALASDEAE